jgi:hypothetical protein
MTSFHHRFWLVTLINLIVETLKRIMLFLLILKKLLILEIALVLVLEDKSETFDHYLLVQNVSLR